ncbi:MAG: TonB-dependent receptor [Marinilabilia sp.]
MLKKCILFLFLLMAGVGVVAQQTVTGKVTDSSDEPIPGASVLEKGTSNGTVTQMDGTYSLEVDEGATLVFSFVGFEEQEIPVEGRSSVDVEMQESVTGLDEVVVVGYGVQQKKLVTGATTQLGGEKVSSQKTTNVLEGMKGQSPGVNISSGSAQPGEGMKVNIRGLGTVGDASPLYIVDGVQTDDITYLNSSDIESIDVLKDAASAAIYGSRAANGVVLITTKQGEEGKATVTYDGYFGVQNLYKKMPYMDKKEYAVIMNEQYLNSGQSAVFDQEEINDLEGGTDWIDMVTVDDAVVQNHSLGVSGGNEQSIYSLGASYTSQEGIVGGQDKSNYERFGFRLNTEYELIEDHARIGQHLTYAYSEKKGIQVGDFYSNTLGSAYRTTAFLDPYDDDGNVNPTGLRETSPYLAMQLNNNDLDKSNKLLGDIYLEVEPVEGLQYRGSFTMDYDAGNQRDYTPVYDLGFETRNEESEVSQDFWDGKTFGMEQTLSYDFLLGERHSVNALTGMSAQKTTGDRMWARKYGLLIDAYKYAYLSNAKNVPTAEDDITGEPYVEDKLESYFGRLNYDFDEKYMLTAIFRADGSSKFAEGNRWGYFPSVSAGWVLTNEPFMEALTNWMDFFKIRGSWGQNGNQSIEAFRYMATLTTENGQYAFGSEEGSFETGIYPDKLPNTELQWETSEQTNIGFDAQFLRSRLNANFDYYNKETKDWLVEAPVLDIMGADAPFINAGNVENQGFELGLTWNDNLGELRYGINANISHNKNEVTYIGNASGFIQGGQNLLYRNATDFFRAEEGHPIGYFYGLETAGIFQNAEEIEEWEVQPDAKPGDIKFVDHSGPEGIPDGKIDQNDRTEIGDPNPDYTFGLSFNAEYRGVDLSVTTSGAMGHQIAMGFMHDFNEPRSNYHQAYLERWHGEGTSGYWPRVTNNNEANGNWTYVNDLLIDDGDYWKINTVTLGYDLTHTWNNAPFSELRVYLTGQNLYTFTDYLGMDPEVGYGVEDDAGRNYSSGIDVGYYPHPRTYMFGVNVKF